MSIVVDTRDFIRKCDAISKAYSRMPNEVAAIAVNFSKERFVEQAWLDVTKTKWRPLKRKRKGNRSNTVLVATGRLKRSIRKIYADTNRVIIGTDVPYAEIHNNGGTIKETVTVKQHNVAAYKRKAYSRTRKGRTEKIKAGTVKAHVVQSHQRKMNLTITARTYLAPSYTLTQRCYLHMTVQFIKALK
ncbi:phage virion morphogenesis protein [Paludibacter sp.]|uniref:phage virion morphogenesis protein n=1 Tax=Paludibacter sp. TaxID=1898105 RepID=UPI001355CF2D|nr:phage virion morphogenesis protein [Paludibacter sp.]MTK53282.1 hypothetical protein [Paludibacter sp.]